MEKRDWAEPGDMLTLVNPRSKYAQWVVEKFGADFVVISLQPHWVTFRAKNDTYPIMLSIQECDMVIT
jgi:hypothetical protein